MQSTFIGRTKSVVGTALNGLGILVFYENLHQAAEQFSHFLSLVPREALGVLLAVMLTASDVLQAYGADYRRALQSCLLHILVSSWPFLLIIAGTVLSRDRSTDNIHEIRMRVWEPVDPGAGRSTSK